MPRNHSHPRCNNCRAIGHLKRECPLLKPTEIVHIGGITLEERKKPSTSHKKTQESSKKDDCKILILTEQNPALAHLHMCDLCDEYGHYEYDCELFIKAKKEQEEYGGNWRKRWGEKIKKNEKRLQSMSKPSQSGMQCQYCNSIHHTTDVCYLTSYDVKED